MILHPYRNEVFTVSAIRTPRRPHGFTLIEVLVVVAIIALLVAILLPSLSKARAQARTAVCQSNSKQHATAANMFAVESKGLVPRGGNRNTIHWTQLVLKQMGSKLRTRNNLNLVPVERFEVYQCPERKGTHPGEFLDYVINALDHRGPVAGGCSPNGTSGVWHEVQGVGKLEYWKRPAETVYIMDAAREDDENLAGVLQQARLQLEQNRTYTDLAAQAPANYVGIDFYDVFSGGQVPLPEEFNTQSSSDNSPRASYDMHGKRGSVASFADAHVEIVRPPSETLAPDRITTLQYYWRKFGVQDAETITTEASGDNGCRIGIPNWNG